MNTQPLAPSSEANYGLRHLLVASLATLAVAGAVKGAPAALSALHEANEAPVVDVNNTHNLYEVQPGDTLFNIAQRAEPGTDPRDTVTAITNAQVEQGVKNPSVVQPGDIVPLPDNARLGVEYPGNAPSHIVLDTKPR